MVRNGFNQYGLNRSWKVPKSYVGYGSFSLGDFSIQNQTFNLNSEVLATYTKQLNSNFNLRGKPYGANRWTTYRDQYQTSDGLAIPEFYNLSNSDQSAWATTGSRKSAPAAFSALLIWKCSIVYSLVHRPEWLSLPCPYKTIHSFTHPLPWVVWFQILLIWAWPRYHSLKLRGSWSVVNDGAIPNSSGLGNAPYNHIRGYNAGINWTAVLAFWAQRFGRSEFKTANLANCWSWADVRFLNGRIGVDVALFRIRDYKQNKGSWNVASQAGTRHARVNAGGESLRKGLGLC